MIPYFYIIKHKVSGKYYAGSRTSKKSNPSELLEKEGYVTSSGIVKHIIETEGIDSFEIIRTKTFSNPEEAYDYETRFLRKVNAAKNKSFLNLHNNNFNLGRFVDGEFISFASMGGKVAGNMCANNGHLDRIRELVDQEKRKEAALLAMYEKQSGWFSITTEERKKYSSMGGKVQGPKNAETGHINRIRQLVDEEKRLKNLRDSLSKNKTGCFLDPELRKISSSLGGKVQGTKNDESGHLKNISNDYWEGVRNGTIQRSKKFWYNNGNEEKQIPIDSEIPVGFVKGRLKRET